MKKLFFSCLLLLFLIPICSYAKINVTGVPLGDSRVWEQLSTRHKTDQSIKLLQRIVLLPKDSYNKTQATKMVERLSRIDASILLALSKSDVKMKLFKGQLTDEPAFQHLKGVQPKGWSDGKTWDDVPGAGGSTIAAAKIGSSEPGIDHGSINLELHEIAHSIDNIILQTASKNAEFLRIWEREAPMLFPENDYFISYSEEYFAETFAMYYLSEKSRKKLQKHAPDTFHFIKKLENPYHHIEVVPHI